MISNDTQLIRAANICKYDVVVFSQRQKPPIYREVDYITHRNNDEYSRGVMYTDGHFCEYKPDDLLCIKKRSRSLS